MTNEMKLILALCDALGFEVMISDSIVSPIDNPGSELKSDGKWHYTKYKLIKKEAGQISAIRNHKTDNQ